ncbi:MAG: acyltransferase [Alphaproteobacteria bacterium]|nr:acyltransferase [Alphaproteobacteria bacterium]
MQSQHYLYSAQVLRVVAILAVIVIHTAPFAHIRPQTEFTQQAFLFVNTSARFAIPLFFILSGYLFAQSIDRRGLAEAARTALSRVALVYVVWSLIFAVLPRIKHFKKLGYLEAIELKTIGAFQAAPWDFLFSGTGTHLWYLVAFALAVAMTTLFLRFGGLRVLLLVTGLFYVLGLLGGLYNRTPLGIDLFMGAYLGPFGGPFLFALGVWQAGRTVPRDNACFWLILLGMVSIHVEMLAMREFYGTPQQSFYLGCVPVALGLLRFAVSRPDWGRDTVFAQWGTFTLGIYVAHPVMLRIPRLLEVQFDSLLWQLGYPLLIFAATLGVCMLAARTPRLARVVT